VKQPTICGNSLKILERLISFDTTSRKSNLDCIDFIRSHLSEFGIKSELSFNDEKTKANLLATLGPAEHPGVLLAGHTDVVPIDGQGWKTNPFRMHEHDGRLYGRGTADMKGFLAITLALVPELLEIASSAPIHLAFTYDEEVGCLGVQRLIPQIERLPMKPIACVIGEPTEMRVVIGHKGKTILHCEVRGLECHSALDEGVNAIEIAAEIVTTLRTIGRRLCENGPFDSGFNPPHTTIQTGVIHGGTAVNILPKACDFWFEFRCLPNQPPEALIDEIKTHIERDLLPEMRARSTETGIFLDVVSDIPGLQTPEEADVVALAKNASGGNATEKISFCTEGGVLQEAGIPTIICGPGSVKQAHKPDEFVTVAQLRQAERFLRSFVRAALLYR